MTIFSCSVCKKWNTDPNKPSKTWASEDTFPKTDDVIFCVCITCRETNAKELAEKYGTKMFRGV